MNAFIDAARAIDIRAYRAGQTPTNLIIEDAGDLMVTYAPFDHINRSAELVLVGLTPGRTQAANAIEALSSAMAQGRSLSAALESAKSTASFSGGMRSSLIAMLDQVGVPGRFGRRTAAEFFEPGSGLVHFTSALRYPVYLKDGSNYSGAPRPLSHPVLRTMVDTHLAEEARVLPKAVWVPLGGPAELCLEHLAARGLLDRNRILSGMPHPSGANAERIAYFLGRKPKERLSAKTNADRIDTAREMLTRRVAALAT